MSTKKLKLVRMTTVPMALCYLLKGQLKFMSKWFDMLAISSPGPMLDQAKEAEGVRVKAVRMTRAITPFRDGIALLRLIGFLIIYRPHIIHTHTPKASLVGIVAGWICRVPHRIYTVAGLPLIEATGFKRRLLLFVERIIMRCATHVHMNSSGLREFVISEGLCSAERCFVLGHGSSNGIDTSYFQVTDSSRDEGLQIRSQLGIKDSDHVFCFVGRLVRDKGIVELVDSFLRLANVHTHCQLVLVGLYEPDLDPLPDDIVEHINTHDRIHMVGFQKDIRPYLSLSDSFVLPTYREGFPNVVMQAGCFSLPCIVTDINGCNEIIRPEENGLIVPPKSVDDLYAAMDCFLTDPDLGKRLASVSRDLIVSRYDQTYFWGLLLEFYQSLDR